MNRPGFAWRLRGGLSSDERASLKDLEREHPELRRQRDLEEGVRVFAQAELDRRPK